MKAASTRTSADKAVAEAKAKEAAAIKKVGLLLAGGRCGGVAAGSHQEGGAAGWGMQVAAWLFTQHHYLAHCAAAG